MEKKICWGLVRRRDCLVPTWRGWLLLVLSLAALSVVTVRELYPFLAVTEPVERGLLVVEGWVSDFTMEATVAEFKRHHYEKVYVTGGPIDHSAWLSYYKTYAEEGTATLLELGLNANQVQAIPSKWVRKDRTYVSAAALRKWMRDTGVAFTAVHLITQGAHARRSRLLFQRALGSGVTVGVTSVPSNDYDPEHWWQSSAGVREVIGEMLAYGYSRFLFWMAEE
ncbi:MAG: YdcF family protein [Deltaproteobacteria bacterium]|nr:MAG: YdcF family protein [Deltaproteobacteria bacterium]